MSPFTSRFALPAMLLSLLPMSALALPSFADQTGQPCGSCHTIAFGPALTPYGQQFKLNGYVLGGGERKLPGLVLMQIFSLTHTQAKQDGGAAPHFGDNNNVAADQTSLFYAGRIAGKLGALVQATYDGIARRGAWDNLDIRYADHGQIGGHGLVWGVSLNNNPTVQDLWNSTPAWSFPYLSSALAPTPAAAPLLEGALAREVAGLTAYTMIDNFVYLEAGAYRRLAPHLQKALGVAPEETPVVRGLAPYWRAALQRQSGAHYASLGVFGLAARVTPGGDGSAGADHYTDLGYDATYQFGDGGAHRFNANLTYLHELQNLNASAALGAAASARNQLNTLRLNGGWVYRQTVSLSAGTFRVHGGADAVLYAPDAIGGSANGSPNSRGFISQLEYVPFGKAQSWLRPWVNLRLGLQYTYYTQFNGGGVNYDGSGRSAHDNDTVFAFVWLAF